ncbi:Uma2 family endonuclease [Nocardia sp. NBC_01503]|uniref:Uma2 family endonuclease n=1 Tax=Nocardia sp. NBC_01503 TaxID=2975997 RepID=UPI002E7C3967|nr:Uma2 family endonuclease [Nocardia sp. NBC_01503]WTL33400.1 Uma2 family endonuclease [Nocardia sp. NBC_01503]
MSIPHIDPPPLPETMTWEELMELPEEISCCIELHDGQPVWIADAAMLKHGPSEHQRFTLRMTNALLSAAKLTTADATGGCWDATLETNLFFTRDRSSFVTPDFMIYHCLDDEFAWVHAEDTILVGEVLSPSNTPGLMEVKKARYAAAHIPWYWEVELAPNPRRISAVRQYALAAVDFHLPKGVTPLRPPKEGEYILTGEWTPEAAEGVGTLHPFPIHIPWSDLAY